LAWACVSVSVSVSVSALALEGNPAVAAPALDTLLYTPAQRDDILRARQPQSGTSLLGSQQRLSGVVRRGNGKSTVWVNGKPLPEGAPKTPALKGIDAVLQGKRLRVGESIDPASGARTDLVAPGAVVATPQK
jgi:hypothetical protein